MARAGGKSSRGGLLAPGRHEVGRDGLAPAAPLHSRFSASQVCQLLRVRLYMLDTKPRLRVAQVMEWNLSYEERK